MPLNYSLQSFCNDLKALLIKTGVDGQPMCLFLENHQLVNPGFLECISGLLTGGEVCHWTLCADAGSCLPTLQYKLIMPAAYVCSQAKARCKWCNDGIKTLQVS